MSQTRALEEPLASMIRVRNLVKHLGGRRVIDDVSFDVRRGETLGLLGPNGAGKTTLMHLLLGLLRPDAGTIEIQHERADHVSPNASRAIGFAPQVIALYDDLTAEENLGFFARLYGLSRNETRQRVEESLAFAELADRRRDLVRTYSGGMRRRLNLACAVVHGPELLLLDEPTALVDPQSRRHIYDVLAELKTKQRTILHSTHHMDEAELLCDRVAILDRGRLLAIDTVDALVNEHGDSAATPPKSPPRSGDLSSVFFSLTGRDLRD